MSKLSDLLTITKYDIILPQSKKTFKFRPFLVKEQRILLQAQQEKDEAVIVNSLMELIHTCTFGDVKPKELSPVDFEYLILQIRAKSVGETFALNLTCPHCRHETEYDANVDQLVISSNPELTNTVKLEDNLFVVLQVPSIDDAIQIGKASPENQLTLSIIASIKSIVAGDEVFETSEQSPEEVEEFVGNLNQVQLASIQQYLDGIPTLTLPVKYSCEKCGQSNELVIKGLMDFFI